MKIMTLDKKNKSHRMQKVGVIRQVIYKRIHNTSRKIYPYHID